MSNYLQKYLKYKTKYLEIKNKIIGGNVINHNSSREDVLKAVQENGYKLIYANKIYRADQEIALEAIKNNYYVFIFCSDTLKQDIEFILKAIKLNSMIFAYIKSNFRKDSEFISKAIKENGMILSFLNYKFRKDRTVVLEAVKQNGKSLQFAHEDFKKDRTVVLEAVKQNGMSLQFAHNDLKKDRTVVLEAVKQNGKSLKFAHEDFKKDRTVVLEAVKQNGESLKFAHNDLKKDSDIVLEAVKQNGKSLQFAHEDFKKDRTVVLEAVRQNGESLKFAHNDLKNNKDFILEVVRQNGMLLQYIYLKSDEDVILEAIKQNSESLQFAYNHLKNKDFILKAVAVNGMALKFAHEDLKNNKDFILKAVAVNGMALKFAHEDLKKNKDFILKAVAVNGMALKFAHEDLKNNKDFILEVVAVNGMALQYTHITLDEDVILEAIKQNPESLKFVDNKLQEYLKLYYQYKDNPLKIYHIGFKQFRLFDHITQLIEYTNIRPLNNDFFKIELNKILNNTEDIIVIFIEDVSYDIIELLNILIEDIDSDRKNIKIINENNIPIKNNFKFYKIINIKFVNDPKDIDTDYEFVFKTIQEDVDHSSFRNFLEYHWLIPLINAPRCLENRLLQFTGTCWFNAMLNSLLLVTELRDCIKLKLTEYKSNNKDKKFFDYKDFRNENNVEDAKHLLFVLLENYFNGKKPLKSDNNFLLPLAALIKEKYKRLNKELPYTLLSKISKEDKGKPLYYLCKATETNELRQKMCGSKDKEKVKLTKTLNELCDYIHPKSICDTYDDNTDEKLGFIYGNGGVSNIILIILQLIFDIEFDFDKEVQLENGSIIFISTKENKEDFKLCSAYILVRDETHAIVGLNCGVNQEVVYDSYFNIWAYQKWSDLSYNSEPKLLSNFEHEFKKKKIFNTYDYYQGFLYYKLYVKTINN